MTPRGTAPGFEVWSAHDGSVVSAVEGPFIDLTLEPYEAAVVVACDQVGSDRPLPSDEPGPKLSGWTAGVGDGEQRPVSLPHEWESTLGLERYCGSVTYEAEFALDAVPDRLVVDLGTCRAAPPEDPEQVGTRGRSFRAEVLAPVGEVAQVRVNGHACGVVWAPPYEVDITDAAQQGCNEIQIVVSSTLAHALADDPHVEARAAEVTGMYGQRFTMQEQHLADVGVRSGLLGVPVLRQSSPAGRVTVKTAPQSRK